MGGSIQEFLAVLNGLTLNWTFTYSRTISALGLVVVVVVTLVVTLVVIVVVFTVIIFITLKHSHELQKKFQPSKLKTGSCRRAAFAANK